MDVSNNLITVPLAGAIEYSSQTITSNIDGIAVSNPARVTSTDHQLADGSQVDISGVVGGTFSVPDINALNYIITVIDGDTYDLVGLECT